MELLQSIRVGTHTRRVVDLARASVEHFDTGDVIPLARRLPADGFGLLDSEFPL